MSRGRVPPELQAKRLAAAQVVADAGGNLSDYALKVGMTLRGASRFVRVYSPALHARLSYGAHGIRKDTHSALVRLLLIKSVEGIKGGEARLAKALGLQPQAIWAFRRKWAADGLDAAIADLMPEDGVHG